MPACCPPSSPNADVSALVDLWCKLRVVLESWRLKGAVAPEEGEAAPKGDERDGLSEVHADLALKGAILQCFDDTSAWRL